MKYTLNPNADTTHESAEDWYSSYGAHISTEGHGDLVVQTVEWDWLEDGEKIIPRLKSDHEKLTTDEAKELIALAKRVRSAAKEVVSCLEAAVEAYDAGDLDECVAQLDAASSVEQDHGDDPASKSLRTALISETGDAE